MDLLATDPIALLGASQVTEAALLATNHITVHLLAITQIMQGLVTPSQISANRSTLAVGPQKIVQTTTIFLLTADQNLTYLTRAKGEPKPN
ncbi:MAG: hypothetical protein WCR08_04405 [Gammaproteobacteria bacterium]